MGKLSLDKLVYYRMLDGQWWTFWALKKEFADKGYYYGEPSISAAIRNLRKPHCRALFNLPTDGEVIDRRRIHNGKGYEYKLINFNKE